jgi:4-carboxymuconolactone decarboxylase
MPEPTPDYQQALDTAERLLGQPLVLPLAEGEPPVGENFRRLATVQTFGASWPRGGLDDRSRALVSVAIAATLGTHEPLRGQLRIALRHDQACDRPTSGMWVPRAGPDPSWPS